MEFYNEEQAIKTGGKDTSVTFSIVKVYLFFALGLILSAVSALGFPYLAMAIGQDAGNTMMIYTVGIVVSSIILLPLSLAVSFSSLAKKSGLIGTFYVLYALAMGVLLSSVLLMFDVNDIYYSFLITAGAFIIMSFIGFITKGKTNGMVTFLIGAMFASLILSLVNFFFFNETIYWITSFVMLFVMLIFVAVDTNRVKNLAQSRVLSNSNTLAIFCAYTLYTDFITIFLYVLRFVAIFKNNN